MSQFELIQLNFVEKIVNFNVKLFQILLTIQFDRLNFSYESKRH